MKDEITQSSPMGTETHAKLVLASERTAQKDQAPRVALLGWCDRAARIEGLHPALAHTNVQGLSYARISYIFPFSMRDVTFVLGLYNPRPGETFAVEFRHSDGSKAFDLTMNLTKAQAFDQEQKQFVDVGTQSQEIGWYVVTTQVANDVLVLRPDTLSAFLKSDEGEQFLAWFNLLHASTPLYSPDQVAALRSDPLARSRNHSTDRKCISRAHP